MEFTHGLRRALMNGLGIVYFVFLGFDVKLIAALFAVSTIIGTFFEFPTGAISDYDSRKKSIAISFFLMAIAFFGIFAFTNFWLLAFFWTLGDIAWTFYSGSGSAWSIDALGIGKKKNKIVSLISKGYFFEKGGQIIGGLIGLVVIAINFRFIWLAISLSNLFMCLIVIKYMEERNFKPEKAQHNYVMKALIKAKESFFYVIHKKSKELRVLMLGSLLGNLTFSAFLIAMPLFFTQILKISPEKLSGILGIIAAITIMAPLLAEKITHKMGVKKSMITFVLMVAIFVIVFALSKSLIFAVGALIVIKYGLVIVSVIEDSAYQHRFDPKLRASLGSANNFIWAIGYSISVLIAGFAIDAFGVIPTLIACGILTSLEAFVYLFGLK
jgi:MFS family permease